MRLLFILSFLLVSTFLFARQGEAAGTFVKPLPVPHKPVNDFAGFLTAVQRKTLQLELKSYLKRTTNAIVIVTLDSLTDPKTKEKYSVEDAALMYFNTWGIGDSIKNNGVLLLVSRNPKRMRIEVGTGLEAVLDNSFCQEVIDSSLVPAFKKEYYFTGFKKAITALVNRLDNPPPPPDPQPAVDYSTTSYYTEPETASSGMGFGIISFIFVIIGGFIMLLGYGGRTAGGTYTRSGYSRHHERSVNYFLSDNADRHSNWSSGSDDSWSSSSSSDSFSSFSDSSSSSSSSTDSYSGGSSDGGGASGSW